MKAKLLIKKEGLKTIKDLSLSEYQEIKNAIYYLDDFDYLNFLSVNHIKARDDFRNFDFSAPTIKEVDAFNIIFNALNSIVTNLNLWQSYLKRNYFDDTDVYSIEEKEKEKQNKGYKAKSCYDLSDSDLYDNVVEYAVMKALRNLAVHSQKPYSDIIYFDDWSRHFVIYTRDLLEGDILNKSGKEIVIKSKYDYFDVVQVIEESFKALETLNVYIYNMLLNKNCKNYYSSRLIIKEYLPMEFDGAYLTWINDEYCDNHILKAESKNISINAMNRILGIASENAG